MAMDVRVIEVRSPLTARPEITAVIAHIPNQLLRQLEEWSGTKLIHSKPKKWWQGGVEEWRFPDRPATGTDADGPDNVGKSSGSE